MQMHFLLLNRIEVAYSEIHDGNINYRDATSAQRSSYLLATWLNYTVAIAGPDQEATAL